MGLWPGRLPDQDADGYRAVRSLEAREREGLVVTVGRLLASNASVAVSQAFRLARQQAITFGRLDPSRTEPRNKHSTENREAGRHRPAPID